MHAGNELQTLEMKGKSDKEHSHRKNTVCTPCVIEIYTRKHTRCISVRTQPSEHVTTNELH